MSVHVSSIKSADDVLPFVPRRMGRPIDSLDAGGHDLNSSAVDTQSRIAQRNCCIAEFKDRTKRDCNDIINDIAKRSPVHGFGIPAASWECLRQAFTERLEVFELQARYDCFHSCPSTGPAELYGLLKEMLDAELRFGGVLEEELIRVYRSIYPKGAKRVLPRTAEEMWAMRSDIPLDQTSQTAGTAADYENRICSPEIPVTGGTTITHHDSSKDDVPSSDYLSS